MIVLNDRESGYADCYEVLQDLEAQGVEVDYRRGTISPSNRFEHDETLSNFNMYDVEYIEVIGGRLDR